MHGKPSGRQPNCVCKTCGAAFYTKPSLIRLRNGGQHCSLECKWRDPDAVRRGAEHHGWKGDSVQVDSGRQRAQRLYAADACERCGASPAERHHIDAHTSNNAPENIAILCRRCHMATDGRLARLRTAQNRKLTAEQAAEIRRRYDALARPGMRRPKGSVAALAAEFGVGPDTVKQIGAGKLWRDAA